MTTFILVALALGAVVGGGIGFKLGRSYERVRPTRRANKSKKTKK